MTSSLRFNLIVVFGILGAGLGAFVLGRLPDQNPLWLGLAGFFFGLQIGNLVFKERNVKTERKHIHIPKDMRDSYYTDLVMKRILEIYRPEQAESEDDGESEDEDDEEEQDEDETEETEKSAYEDTSDQFRWKD